MHGGEPLIAYWARVRRGQYEQRERLEDVVPTSPYHLFGELHRRRVGLGITAEDVAKVDVEHVPISGHHQVVEVAVTDSHQVCDHAVPRAALDIRIHCVLVDLQGTPGEAVRGKEEVRAP